MSTTNETTQAVLPPDVQAPDVKDDPSLARLLFCETLLEEYEGMTQPEDDLTVREIRYESMYQPDLNQTTLKDIRLKIQQHWSKDERERKKDEPRFEGDTVKSIYKMIIAAQIAQVAKARAALEEKHKSLEEEKRNKAVEDEVLGQVLGESYKRSHQPRKDGNPTPPEAPPVSADRDLMQQTKGNGNGTAAFQNSLTAPEAEKLAAKTLRSALCLSGGGIRSATFNLGILQGLARHGLLGKFDYLSTVSGGGFIGGWLSAWIRRAGIGNVVNALQEKPETPLTPDPPPVEHLRVYSNYLSPQPGLLSADTWTLIATFVRNLLLNWLVFVPVFIAMLLLPRMWASIVLRSTLYPKYAIPVSFGIGFLASVFALTYVARSLPTANDYKSQPSTPGYKTDEGEFIFRCLLWQIVSAMALSVCIWCCYQPGQPPPSWILYAVFFVTIMIVPLIVFFDKVKEITPVESRGGLRKKLAVGIALIMLVQVMVGYIASAVINLVVPQFHTQEILYSIFSVPIILLLVSVEGLLITGFASRLSKDDDQEWWARAGAWVLIVIVTWILVHSLVIYGPLLLLALGGTLGKMRQTGLSNLNWSDIGTLLGTIAGVVSGAVTLLGGFSAKTPANSKEAEKAGTANVLLGIATQLLAPIFLGFLVILLSLATNWLLISRPSQILNRVLTGYLLPYPSSPLWEWHILLVKETTFRLLAALAVLITLFGVVMGLLISTNVFSLQFMWRNRIIRAYLGASNQEKRRPDPFTGFDTLDNLQMHELWPQPGRGSTCGKREDRPEDDLRSERYSRKLFHVLNLALNLTGGEKLQWQDRKAESFTVSPLHAGSYWLGYRRSTHYGGTDGITLGAAIAISGAFVSPNMGFMMTSPVVRFLMAVFNVRFGWWLGNPGPAGDDTNRLERLLARIKELRRDVKRPFRLDSPRLSIKPFLAEAIGRIDDKSSYVYLSDGGHFENLGLYEMVLRRCRFIVVSDATTDPEYSFESLAQSIRQIRVDLGVPIDIPELTVGVPSQDLKSKYCAVGKIRYSCVDRDDDDKKTDDDYDGILIFIKPSLIGKEPRDVVNYWQGRGTFPQEVITDQWFSEAQFESYRTLGSSIIEAICDDNSGQMTLAAFSEKAREHNQLNFSVFRNEAGFMALEHQIKQWLQETPVPDYESKVRRFMKTLIR